MSIAGQAMLSSGWIEVRAIKTGTCCCVMAASTSDSNRKLEVSYAACAVCQGKNARADQPPSVRAGKM